MARLRFRYSTIVAVASFGALLAISAVIVWFAFWYAQRSLDAELKRQELHFRRITELHIGAELKQLENFLRSQSRDNALLSALKASDISAIESTLARAFYELDSGQLDILFLAEQEKGALIDVSSTSYDTSLIVNTISTEPLPGIARLISSSRDIGEPLYAFINGLQVLDPETGAVVARLFGGVILNDNLQMLREILADTDIVGVALEIDGHLVSEISNIPDFKFGDPAIAERGLGRELTIPFSVPQIGPETMVRVIRASSPIAELRETYFSLVPAVIGLTLAVSLLLSWFIRQLTKSSLSKLSEYADAVAGGIYGREDIPQFKPGVILDFNKLGETLERVFEAFRASEYQAQTVIDRAPAAIYAKDLTGRYIIANAQFLSILELERDRVIGARDSDLLPEEFAREVHAFETSTSERTGGVVRELTFPTSGGERAYLGAMFPLKQETGETYAHCTILADITDRKRTETALRQAKEEAEFANSAKTSFLAGVSHELRTPLNAIIGFSEMIAGEVLGKIENRNYVEYAGHIQSSGTHLLSLIGDVLDLSVIESRKETVREEALDIEEICEGCLRMIREQAAEAGVEVGSNIDMRGHALKADARRIRQILINLLTNAVKFTPAGGHVVLTGAVGKDRRVLLSVADDGIGMDSTTKAHAFEPFMQGNSSLIRKAEGAGLGLALVKRLAELHDAELHCTSAPGQGTTISIVFPVSRSVSAPPQVVPEISGN
ncbi:ATP-binding protein [Nisaea sp.]|uniref:ATP-binding protein n=1 Tax=Nisaea sp. TaxID=2024842 RepID=UPI003B520288